MSINSMLINYKQALFIKISLVILSLLLLQVDKILLITFSGFEFTPLHSLTRTIIIFICIYSVIIYNDRNLIISKQITWVALFIVCIYTIESTSFESSYGDVYSYTELVLTFWSALILSNWISRNSIIIILYSIAAFSTLFLLLHSLGFIDASIVPRFDALCSRPTWKYSNKIAIFLSISILAATYIRIKSYKIMFVLACVAGIWILKSRLALVVGLISIGYLYFSCLDKKNIFLVKSALIYFLFFIVATYLLSDIFSRQTIKQYRQVYEIEFPICIKGDKLKHKLETAYLTRTHSLITTIRELSLDVIIIGRGKKEHQNWKEEKDLNYIVPDNAKKYEYRNPSTMSSSNFFIELIAQYGILSLIFFLLSIYGLSSINGAKKNKFNILLFSLLGFAISFRSGAYIQLFALVGLLLEKNRSKNNKHY